MQKKSYKIGKYLNILLLVLAILITLISIFVAYSLLKNASQDHPTSLLPIIFLAVIGLPILDFIVLVICLVFMFKDKPWSYFVTGLISASIFLDSINTLFKYQIGINWRMVLTSIFWIILIILSFYMHSQTRKKSKKK
ncbi:MAG: hypothetical protein NTZ83_02980 [Candidatus Pacearchaeota archaeon]|nr:hypothetical protein [Candidatus Pacearchaeota archaeon]